MRPQEARWARRARLSRVFAFSRNIPREKPPRKGRPRNPLRFEQPDLAC